MTADDLERRGPATRARQEGRDYGIRLRPHAMTVRVDEQGRPRTPIAPHGAVVGACRLCPARCCHLEVTVSIVDAVKMSSALRVPLFAGLTVVHSDHRDHSFRLDADPRFGAVDDGSGRAELALKRRDGRCHALVEMGGYLRCGIYEARPSYCRTYPAIWTSDVAEGGGLSVQCPVPYGITDAEAEGLERDIAQSIEEWELHDDIVASWNESAGPFTIEGFVKFAAPIAARHLGIEIPDALAEGTADARLDTAMRGAAPLRGRRGSSAGMRAFAGLPARQKNDR